MSNGDKTSGGTWDGLDGLDKLLDHRVRLGICVLLARDDELALTRLRELLGETDGSLGANLRRLEEARYVQFRKEFQGRKPVTWYALTARGREVLQAHLRALNSLIDAAEVDRRE